MRKTKLLTGPAIILIGIMLLILILLTIFTLFLISSKLWDPKTACWVALLFAVGSYCYLDADMLAFNMEFIAAFFSVIGAFFIISYVMKRLDIFLVLSGIFFGIAFFSKQPAIFDFFAALSFSGIALFAESGSFRRATKAVSLLMAGFCLTFFTVVLYFYLNNSLQDFYFCFWTYGIKYYVPTFSLLEKITVLLCFISPKSFLRENICLLIFFVVGAVMTMKRVFSRAGKISMKSFVEPYFIAWGARSICRGLPGRKDVRALLYNAIAGVLPCRRKMHLFSI